MVAVTSGPRGTAQRIGRGAAYSIAGKTGTAQVFSVGQTEKYNEKEVAERLRDHALFVAFAPADSAEARDRGAGRERRLRRLGGGADRARDLRRLPREGAPQ